MENRSKIFSIGIIFMLLFVSFSTNRQTVEASNITIPQLPINPSDGQLNWFKGISEREITEEKFLGIWKDRTDLKDSNAWVRKIRRSEWKNSS